MDKSTLLPQQSVANIVTVGATTTRPFSHTRILLTNVWSTSLPLHRTPRALEAKLLATTPSSLVLWNALLSLHLQPIASRGQRLGTIIFRVKCTVYILFLLAIIAVLATTVWMRDSKQHFTQHQQLVAHVIGTCLNYTVLVGSWLAFSIWQGRAIQSLLIELENAIQHYEDVTSFQQQSGLAIKCQHDGLGFSLLIVNAAPRKGNTIAAASAIDAIATPTGVDVAVVSDSLDFPLVGRNDSSSYDNHFPGVVRHDKSSNSLRLLLSVKVTGWTRNCLSHLDAAPSAWLPRELATLLNDDWFDMYWTRLSRTSRRVYRLQAVTDVFLVIFMLVCFQTVVRLHSMWIIISMQITHMVLTHIVACLELDLIKLSFQAKAEFEQRGLVVSYDNAHEFTRHGILYTARYLYLFPIAPAATHSAGGSDSNNNGDLLVQGTIV